MPIPSPAGGFESEPGNVRQALALVDWGEGDNPTA